MVILSNIWTVYLETERNLPKRKSEIRDIRHCLQDRHCDLGDKWGRRGGGGAQQPQEGGRGLGRAHLSALKYSSGSRCVEEGLQDPWGKFIVDDQ